MQLHFTMKGGYHRAVGRAWVCAVVLSACSGGGLTLRVEIGAADLDKVDEVRVRVAEVPRLVGADLGGTNLRSSNESGVEVTPRGGEALLSFKQQSFALSSQVEVRLEPDDGMDHHVVLGAAMFRNGGWVGGDGASQPTTLSPGKHTDVTLTLACGAADCSAIDVVDLQQPAVTPAVFETTATQSGDPLQALAFGPLGASSALVVADSAQARIYRPLDLTAAPHWPDRLQPTLTILAKSGEPFGAAAAIGDLDGDGVADLAIGSPSARGGSGLVDVFSGAALPSSGLYVLDTNLTYAMVRRIHGENGEGLGAALAIIPGASGNLLAIGAPNAGDAGAIYAIQPQAGEISSTAATAKILGPAGAHAGAALAADVFDVSNALAIGAGGRIYLVRAAGLTAGTTVNLPSGAEGLLTGPAGFGTVLATGALGAGPHALAVGAPDSDQVFVFQGGSIDSWHAPQRTLSGLHGTRFGASVAIGAPAAAGPALLVGAPASSPLGRVTGGAAWLFRSSAAGSAGSIDVGSAAFVAWGANDQLSAGAQVAFGPFDIVSPSDLIFVGQSGLPGAAYGIEGLPSP
jgi:hypothetical protein